MCGACAGERRKFDQIDACGSDGDGGEDGSMGLEADPGAVSEVEGGALMALVKLLSQLRPRSRRRKLGGGKCRSRRNWTQSAGPRPGESRTINMCGSRGCLGVLATSAVPPFSAYVPKQGKKHEISLRTAGAGNGGAIIS